MTPRSLLALLLAALLVGCSGGEERGGAGSLPGPVPSGVSFSSPDPSAPPAPDFSLELMDGTTVSGEELWSVRPVVLFFFASWCGRCAEQQRDLTALAERYGDAVAFLGVAGEDEREAIAAYLDEHEVPYATGLDADLSVWRSYAVQEPPQVAVIARGGRLVRGWPGGADRDVIRGALDEVVRLPG